MRWRARSTRSKRRYLVVSRRVRTFRDLSREGAIPSLFRPCRPRKSNFIARCEPIPSARPNLPAASALLCRISTDCSACGVTRVSTLSSTLSPRSAARWTSSSRERRKARLHCPRQRRDAVRDRERALRHLLVQQLDHFAVELDRALAGVLGQGEGGDDRARALDLCIRRREGRVANVDLVRVDQRLAVEAHVAALLAFGFKADGIVQVVIDAVDDVAAV